MAISPYVKTLAGQNSVSIKIPKVRSGTETGTFVPSLWLLDDVTQKDLVNKHSRVMDRKMILGHGRRQRPKRVPSYRERQRRHRTHV